MHRTRNNALEAPTKGNDNEKSIYKHDEGKSKKGIRKRIEVVISKLRHQACRTKIRKGVHVLFAASIIASAIILLLNMFSLPYHRSRRIPRNMVQLVGEKDYVRLQFLSQMKLEPLINYRPERIKHKHGHESFENGNCKAMHQWQVEAYPTCNKLHEIDPNNLNLVASGGFRDVFAMKDWNGTTVAVKTLLDGSSYSYRHYDRHRRDAVAMSLLTSSKHIPNIYGYCINSGMFDFTPDGSLDDHIYSEEKWTKQQKLRFSWQATTALADVHGIGMRKDSASISHTDISADQFLWLDGMYKLNDFNRARFIRWDVLKNEPCTFYVENNPGRNRSPEEYKYDRLTEKIDVYSLGNVLYKILTGNNKLFPKLNSTRVMDIVKDGMTPRIPHRKWGAEEQAIIQAIKMCWVRYPKDRSSARDVDSFLKGKLFELNVTML